MIRPRFSLRWLLLFTTTVAVACYVWITWPTAHAERFAAHLNQYEPAAWTELFEAYGTPGLDLKDRKNTEDIVHVILGGVDATAELLPKTRTDLLRGQRRIVVRTALRKIQPNSIIVYQQHIGDLDLNHANRQTAVFDLIDRLGTISRADNP